MTSRWIVALLAVPVATVADAAPCAPGKNFETFIATGPDTAIVCYSGRKGADRSCWKIDGKGAVSMLPEKEWLAPTRVPPPPTGDRFPMKKDGDVEIYAPAPLTVTYANEWEKPATIDVCEGRTCKHVVLRAQAKERTSLQSIYSIVVMPDKKTLWVGLGLGTTAAESLERYDLDNPKAAAWRYPTGTNCASVIGIAGANMVVQHTDCANAGGKRVIATYAGKDLATIGEMSSHEAYWNLGGDKLLFRSWEGAAVWDVAKLKRLALVKADDTDMTNLIVSGARIVALDGATGALTAYNTSLEPTKLAGIPMCK